LAERAGIAGDAALCATVGKAGEGAFPTHPHGERGDFAEGDFRMVTETAFRRAEGEVMLNAVTGEDMRAAVVAMNRESDGHGTFRVFEAITVVDRNFETIRDDIELAAGHVEGGMFVDFHGSRLRDLFF
jgi:hypothetical protein